MNRGLKRRSPGPSRSRRPKGRVSPALPFMFWKFLTLCRQRGHQEGGTTRRNGMRRHKSRHKTVCMPFDYIVSVFSFVQIATALVPMIPVTGEGEWRNGRTCVYGSNRGFFY